MINNPPQDLYVLGERMNHPNPLSFHRGVRNGRHEAPYVAAEVKSSEAPHFQNVVCLSCNSLLTLLLVHAYEFLISSIFT